MSFILDALRKSEQSRAKTLSQSLAQQTVPAGSRGRVPWGLILGGLLLLNALLVLGLWWPGSPSATGPAPAEPVMEATPAGTQSVRSLASEAASSSLPPAINASPAAELDTTAPTAMPTITSVNRPPALPFAALPEDVQAALSPLTLNMHAYADSAAQRLAVINLAPYHEGDVLRAGLSVREITPDGVILDYQGTRFFLPRP